MITVSRLDHFAIAAENTDAMVAWYEKVLGLVVHVVSGPNPPQKQKVYLIGPAGASGGLAQGYMIEVMPRNETPRHNRNSHEPGLSHAAWCVENFDEALAHLKANGVKFLSEVIPAIGGGRIVSFEDCEGNMTQIVERKK
ncbi:MAG TPA: VOC family protein [Phycisphaerae bacterium]|nr:VOC family protein [Phycisphaerae bacterium]